MNYVTSKAPPIVTLSPRRRTSRQIVTSSSDLLPSCSQCSYVDQRQWAQTFFFHCEIVGGPQPLSILQSPGPVAYSPWAPGPGLSTAREQNQRGGPSVSYQEAPCQRTDRLKTAFLWAWVGAIGQESFYIWNLSQSQFGERLFLSLRG